MVNYKLKYLKYKKKYLQLGMMGGSGPLDGPGPLDGLHPYQCIEFVYNDVYYCGVITPNEVVEEKEDSDDSSEDPFEKPEEEPEFEKKYIMLYIRLDNHDKKNDLDKYHQYIRTNGIDFEEKEQFPFKQEVILQYDEGRVKFKNLSDFEIYDSDDFVTFQTIDDDNEGKQFKKFVDNDIDNLEIKDFLRIHKIENCGALPELKTVIAVVFKDYVEIGYVVSIEEKKHDKSIYKATFHSRKLTLLKHLDPMVCMDSLKNELNQIGYSVIKSLDSRDSYVDPDDSRRNMQINTEIDGIKIVMDDKPRSIYRIEIAKYPFNDPVLI